MIYTVTLNPAIDYVIHLSELKTGSINRAENGKAYFGGKGINVSLILKELGITSTTTGFVAGFSGDAIEKGIREKGIRTDFVSLENGLTRINVKLRSENETDINCKGPDIPDEALNQLFSKLTRLENGDMLILSGSIPGTLPDTVYSSILEALSKKDIRVAVDATGNQLMNVLKYKPFLIKPNIEELSEIFGKEVNKIDVEQYAQILKDRGAINVLVSMGGDGSMLLDEHGKKHYMPAVEGKAVNTVGAGDSMVAGFIAGYIQNNNYEYALRLGTAAGSATAFSDGLADREFIYRILSKIN